MKSISFVLFLVLLAALAIVNAQQEICPLDNQECDGNHQEVPEFTTIGAAFATLGTVSYIAYKRKKK